MVLVVIPVNKAITGGSEKL